MTYTDNQRAAMEYDARSKSLLVAYLLWFFLWFVAGHRFYAGKPVSAIIQALLHAVGWATTIIFIGYIPLAIWGLWWLLDALLIPGMIRERNLEVLRDIDRRA